MDNTPHSQCRSPDSILGQGGKSHMPKLRPNAAIEVCVCLVGFFFLICLKIKKPDFPGGIVGKNPPSNAGTQV